MICECCGLRNEIAGKIKSYKTGRIYVVCHPCVDYIISNNLGEIISEQK
ncbi:MAG: hypothetical protein ACFFG0_34165 [Candidatus Thorarchaeota archaeon]